MATIQTDALAASRSRLEEEIEKLIKNFMAANAGVIVDGVTYTRELTPNENGGFHIVLNVDVDLKFSLLLKPYDL